MSSRSPARGPRLRAAAAVLVFARSLAHRHRDVKSLTTTQQGFREDGMSGDLYAQQTIGAQTLRALARYPSRTAFSWPGGSITYRGAIDLIGRLQKVFVALGHAPGTRVASLTA